MAKQVFVGVRLFFVWGLWLSLKSSVAQGLEDYCRTLVFTPPLDGYALVNHVIKNISLERPDTCQISCYVNHECLSYNFGHLKDGSYICQLSNSNNKQHPQDLHEREGFVFQGTENLCSSYPCFAGKHYDNEQWKKINDDAVCFGARGDAYGTLKIKQSGNVNTFKLVHKNGSVKCNPVEPASYWGCTHRNYADRRLLTIITYNDQAIPSLADYSESGSIENCKYYSYRLNNTDVNSTELVFNKLSTPLSVFTGQEFRIWYLQDWKNCFEDDNSGQTCADVYAWYNEF